MAASVAFAATVAAVVVIGVGALLFVLWLVLLVFAGALGDGTLVDTGW